MRHTTLNRLAKRLPQFAITISVIICVAIASTGRGAVPIRSAAPTERHIFQFDASKMNEAPRSVVLAGSFNHFSHSDLPMRLEGNGIYSVTLELAPGLYHYKFLVNGDQWFTDPAADKDLEDMEDHNNSGVIIGFDARKLPAPKADAIEPRGLSHDPKSESDANVASSTTLRLRMHAQESDVHTAKVHFRASDHSKWIEAPLASSGKELGIETFAGTMNPSGAKVEYLFELIDGSTNKFLADEMLYDTLDEAQQHPYIRQMQPKFQTPEWTHHAIWYQIFPERFRNGDESNDPPNTKRWQSKWYATLPGETEGEANFKRNLFRRRYGGDIQGIREQLPYLRSLGITAIYLNPIFAGDSLHKYDTRDYRHIDDTFGVKGSSDELTGESDDPSTWQWSKSDKVFLDFLQDAHKQGFKVVIDGVFNHVGKSNALFQDVLKNGKQSKYADWFEIVEWKDGKVAKYKSWNGFDGDMPLVKKDPVLGLAHGPREYFLAIAKRWLAPDGDISRGVDGFRLDAADRVPHPFWVEFRKVVKSINPNAYITGEIWGWSQSWLDGDQFDAVMNYRFSAACDSFFVDNPASTPPRKLAQELTRVFYGYPLQVVLAQQNVIDSHDTDRFVSRFLNPDRTTDADKKKPYDISKPLPAHFARARQAIAMQMTFAGAPMVYYGDEAGMWSANDPHDRMPMWWKDRAPFDEPEYQFDQEHFDFYQRAIAARRQFSELRNGDFRPVLVDDSRGVFAFARSDAQRCSYIVFNRSSKSCEIDLPIDSDATAFVDWLNPAETEVVQSEADRPTLRQKTNAPLHRVENGKLRLALPPFGSAILVRSGESK